MSAHGRNIISAVTFIVWALNQSVQRVCLNLGKVLLASAWRAVRHKSGSKRKSPLVTGILGRTWWSDSSTNPPKILIQSSDNDVNLNISVVGTNPFCQFPRHHRIPLSKLRSSISKPWPQEQSPRSSSWVQFRWASSPYDNPSTKRRSTHGPNPLPNIPSLQTLIGFVI